MRLRRLEPVLRQALRGPCALPTGSRVLVAVSGGADSTALLVALASLAREFGLLPVAAHLHHGLRGADADADLEHVRTLCARLGVPLLAARWDARARMRRAKLSGESGLRTLRRRFLRGAARRAGAAAIATAHTADDQLETVLMRLARGTGLAGLGGMRPRQGAWLKPLLGATRSDVERDLRLARQAWREDGSNAARDAFRNRVRLDVVPALARAFAPGAPPLRTREGLARRVAHAAADARSGAALAARAARRALARANDGAGGVDAAALARLPAAVRTAALRRFWALTRPRGGGLPRRNVEALQRLLTARTGAEVALPGGWRARRERGRLRLVAPGRRAAVARPAAARAAARTRGTGSAILPGNGAPAARRPGRRNAAKVPGSTPIPTRVPAAPRLERHD